MAQRAGTRLFHGVCDGLVDGREGMARLPMVFLQAAPVQTPMGMADS
jgi:hypothetical protein